MSLLKFETWLEVEVSQLSYLYCEVLDSGTENPPILFGHYGVVVKLNPLYIRCSQFKLLMHDKSRALHH